MSASPAGMETLVKPKKLVILGGGAASLSTAYYLTNDPKWREKFESITLYQVGWRLGGKGASGRGRDGRIEEHGLHIWMGWYENAFRMIRAVYEELGRRGDAPLATWDEAFKPHDFIAFGETVDGKWANWPLEFAQTNDTPGQGGEYPTKWDYVHETLEAIHNLFTRTLFSPRTMGPRPRGLWGWVKAIAAWIARLLKLLVELRTILEAERQLRAARDAAGAARAAARPDDTAAVHAVAAAKVDHHARQARGHLQRSLLKRIESDDETRRLFYIIDTGLTCVAGVTGEHVGVGPHAFDALDKNDFREFLANNGACDETIQSSLILGFYDLLFAYRDGKPDDQKVATGVALRFIFRMVMTYKGAVFWKMQAGMGDTIFAPIHDVLKRRGVRFEFFHRVRNLELSDDRKSVARIQLGRQATLTKGEYRPFVDVADLPCWPSEPQYDQLVEGNKIKAGRYDLESLWTPWIDQETPVTLEHGRDFDQIVFGISLGSVPYVAPELVKASERWRRMVEKVETVRTQAVQLWMTKDIEDLGWTLPSAVADCYPEPLNTWADMTHLLPREEWRGGSGDPPRSLTYFCAPMEGGIPAVDDRSAPAVELAKVRSAAELWLTKYGTTLWPDAHASDGTRFDWNSLFDRNDGSGPARLDEQFWRANIDPSERYVLSVPGSTEFRLRANQPDFDNLFVTGDWTYCGINAGCVEATVVSGMLTSQALTGSPTDDEIVGYSNP